MTKSDIAVMTPESLSSALEPVFAELEALGEGNPGSDWLGEMMIESRGLPIVAANATRRAFQRMGWTSGWPFIDFVERFLEPLADEELRAEASAVLEAARRNKGSLSDAADFDPTDLAASSPVSSCFESLSNLAAVSTLALEAASDISKDSANLALDVARELATELGESAARDFVASIEALVPPPAASTGFGTSKEVRRRVGVLLAYYQSKLGSDLSEARRDQLASVLLDSEAGAAVMTTKHLHKLRAALDAISSGEGDE